MKRILSALLVVTMLAAMFVCWAIPAAADEAYQGFWNTHARAAEELEGYFGERNSIAGFYYYEDGLKVTSADWSKTATSPWSHVSTTEKVAPIELYTLTETSSLPSTSSSATA